MPSTRLIAAVALVLVTACACTGSGTAAVDAAPPTPSASLTQQGGPSAGSPGWQLTHPGPEHAIEGFALNAFAITFEGRIVPSDT